METVIGRDEEKRILDSLLHSGRPELIAIYGRRRVGKTYLVRTHLKGVIKFEMTGIHDAAYIDQLANFGLALSRAVKSPVPMSISKNWLHAFDDLDRYLLDRLDPEKPIVLFFDEFPWMQTPRSNFLKAFDHWWNSSGTKRPNLKVVICGSAASWMIEHIVNDRGGLHNRITQTIRLLPFTLNETERFLKSEGVILDQYQVLQLYMAMGGIPFYLQKVKRGESAAQAIDRLCFTNNGPLKVEFDNLYRSLFVHSGQHEKVIDALSKKGKGLTRAEVIKACKFTSGGGTTKLLKELEESGFIAAYIPFGKTANDSIYKLADEYSLFYRKFIAGTKVTGKDTWMQLSQTASYISWSGIAFESVCRKHVLQIKKALGIEGVLTAISDWRYQAPPKSQEQGAQIDLLLDRQDRCINCCEIKFAGDAFTIDKKYAAELDSKLNVFRAVTGTKKTLFLTMITTYGVRKNDCYTGRVVSEVVMKDLFG